MAPLVRRITLLALAGGILFDVLVPGNAAGLDAPLVMAAFLVAALLVAGGDGIRRMDPADAWLGPVALVLAAMAAIRADDWLVTWDLLFASALAAGAVGCLAGGRITRGLVPRVLELAVGTVSAAGIGAGKAIAAARSAPAGGEARPAGSRHRDRLRRATPVLRGLVIAVPLVAVFVGLFASADAVFARLASDVLAWQPDLDVADLAARGLLIALVAWGAAGLLALAGGLLPDLARMPGPDRPRTAEDRWPMGEGAGEPPAAHAPATQRPAAPAPAVHAQAAQVPPAPSLAANTQAARLPAAHAPAAPDSGPPPAPRAAAHPGRAGANAATWPASPAWGIASRHVDRPPLRLGSTEAATVLVIVDLLFAVFVVLQLAYLFGGRDTSAMAGMTYAAYARRGFLELVLVAVLAGILVVTLDLSVARRTRVQLAGSLVLLGLTGVVLASALLRLRLYQSMYGWTELRFVVLTAIAWPGVALAVAVALLLTRRTGWTLHVLGIMVLVTLGVMGVVGPQAFVTARNLERAIDPSVVPEGGRTGLDTDYLLQLGDEAVVPVVEAWDRLGQADRDALAPALEWRSAQLASEPSLQGWPAWNLSRERARDALAGWEAARGTASR